MTHLVSNQLIKEFADWLKVRGYTSLAAIITQRPYLFEELLITEGFKDFKRLRKQFMKER